MSQKYNSKSPYAKTQISQGGYLDVINFIDLPSYDTDVSFVLPAQYTYRPDLLAYDLYQDSSLWWVFAVRNKDTIHDPIYDMVPGVTLYVPKLTTINDALGV